MRSRNQGRPDVRLTVLVLVALVASAAGAVPLEVRVDAAKECRGGTISVQPGDATVTWRAGETVVRIDAPDAEEWDIRVQSPRCWAAPVRARRGEPVAVRLWRAEELTGKVLLPEGMSAGESVEVRLESLDATAIRCPVKERRFRCIVPATPIDVRIAPEGVAPRYLWDVRAPFDAGELRFGRGGSIAGTIRLPADGPPLGTVRIELAPALPPPTTGGAEAAQRITRSESVRPNARGFFQFAPLEPGQYAVTAKAEGWSPARDPEIHVEEGRETRLARPLTIEPLARVEVAILPPLDPYGEPWRVRLQQLTPIAGTAVEVAAGAASLSGHWSAGGAHTAVHAIDVADHRGNAFARSVVDVSARMPPVTITVDAFGVDGTVRIGETPLAARLLFRNHSGAKAVFRSDAEGRFSGALPADGPWNVEISGRNHLLLYRTVDVRRRDSGAAKLDIELPDTAIDVTVVAADGKPVPASVRVMDGEGRILSTARTDDQGRVRVTAIDAEERVRLSATSRPAGRASGAVAVELDEEGRAEATLVVQAQIGMRGWLVTPSGRPVAGAFVRYLIPHRERFYNEEVSGPNGEFAIALPPDLTALDLVILPPAMPVKLLTIPVHPEMDPNVEIVVGGPSGVLEVPMRHAPPFPLIRGAGRALGLMTLAYPLNWSAPPRDHRPWGMALQLESGQYSVCSSSGTNCQSVTLLPGAVERIDAKELMP